MGSEKDFQHDHTRIIDSTNGVNAYIIDSIGSVDLNEIVKQVTEAMVASDIPITEDQVRRHVRDHVKHQKVIMHQTLNDLVSLSRLTKKSCVFATRHI